MKRIVTNGCFDGPGLHPGHLHLLETARDMGHSLTVLLNSDKSIRVLKGPTRPIMPQELRQAALEACRWVNAVKVFDDEAELEKLIRTGHYDLLVKGREWEGQKITGAEWIDVAFVDRLPQWSTTWIMEGMPDARRGE